MDPVPNNLPLQLSSFIGREREIAEVKRLLAGTRLLTLTGAGGCGKTRLALEVAAGLCGDAADGRYRDGVWLIELASLFDPTLVPQRVAAVFNLREQPGQPLLAALTQALRDRHVLVLLDNCEHLIEACAQLSQSLLETCATVQILATSREALNVAGELTRSVPSLQIPRPNVQGLTTQLAECESVQLFVSRAQAAQPHFTLTAQNAVPIARICRRLDGIPLAIELAAARVKTLSAEQMATRLDHSLLLLSGGRRTALPRQQTMQAAIDWSFVLLSDAERVLFRRLSVFAGGWLLEAAEAVTADDSPFGPPSSAGATPMPAPAEPTTSVLRPGDVLDLLGELVHKSLVLTEEHDAQPRFRLLEPVRQYAQQKLGESGEEQGSRARHLDYFTRFAEAANRKLHAPEQTRWFDRLETEHDNLRAAMDWSLGHAQVASGFRLAAVLHYFWFTRDHLSEGLDWLARFLARPETAARTPTRAHALMLLSGYQGGNQGKMRALAEEALAIGREVGDDEIVFDALYGLTELASSQRDYAEARSLLAQLRPLAPESGDKARIRVTKMLEADILFNEGDLEKARMLYAEGAAIMRELNDTSQLACEVRRLGTIALHQRIYDRAIAYYRESLDLNLAVDDKRAAAACVAGLAAVALAQGQAARAARLFAAVEAGLEAIPTEFQYQDQAEYGRNLALLQVQLVESTLVEAWAEGRVLGLEQAIAEARQIGALALPVPALHPPAAPALPAGLTAREMEVLRWLAKGLTDVEVADQLVVSVRTVNSHLRSIYAKLGVSSRSAATRAALDLKLA